MKQILFAIVIFSGFTELNALTFTEYDKATYTALSREEKIEQLKSVYRSLAALEKAAEFLEKGDRSAAEEALEGFDRNVDFIKVDLTYFKAVKSFAEKDFTPEELKDIQKG